MPPCFTTNYPPDVRLRRPEDLRNQLLWNTSVSQRTDLLDCDLCQPDRTRVFTLRLSSMPNPVSGVFSRPGVAEIRVVIVQSVAVVMGDLMPAGWRLTDECQCHQSVQRDVRGIAP